MAVRPRIRSGLAQHSARRRLWFERLEERRLLSLSHLYTFNDGLANDWIGSAHATLFNGATITAGQLVLSNVGVTSAQTGVVQYARLGANVFSGGDATVEVWFTTTAAPDGMRIFDFGNQVTGAGESYLAFTPQGGNDNSRALFRPSGGVETSAAGLALDDGLQHMAAIVIDTEADLLRLYVDGNEVNSAPIDGASAGGINDALAYVGRSLFDGINGFTGSINELRVYDDARAATDIANDAAGGPSTATKSPLVRQMEYLDRGLVVVRRSTAEAYVGWRLLGTDPAGIEFNLYRSTGGGAPVKLNVAPLTQTTDFVDTTANLTASNEYFVRPIVAGLEQDPSESFTLAANSPVQQFLNVPLQIPAGGTVPDYQNPGQMLAYTYNANDGSVGDLDGDGQYEIVLKWDPSNSKDNSQDGYTGNVFFDAYKLNGTRLWRIDLGKNVRAGAHYSPFLVYDFDGDGRAEVVMKTAPGTVDGLGNNVILPGDNPNADYRNSVGRILSGPEYLTVFDGKTGAALTTINFSPPRGSVSSWGDSYGNRVDRFEAAVAYLDGVHPSIVMTRGYYAKTRLTAFDWQSGQLTQRWAFDSTTPGNSIYEGQGNHSLAVGDVDHDGKDEIIYGSATFDDDGTGLYTTGFGHGDALHFSDLDPNRPGLEVFQSNADVAKPNAIDIHDAGTGQVLWSMTSTNSAGVGRAVAMDIDPRFQGYELWSTGTDGNLHDVHGSVIGALPSNMFYNFGVWWDADPLRELLDGTTISDWLYATLGRQNFSLANSSRASNNGSKSTPTLSGDILADWREEVIWRRSDNTALQIWTTTIPANNRLYTLMHDPIYRLAIGWQNAAYNQPPHPGFFLGDGMAAPPIPQIYTVQAAPDVPGDYNGDNLVDAADYTVWRDTFGSDSNLSADGDGDLVIGPGDYTVWKQNFGTGDGEASIFQGGGAASTLIAEMSNPAAGVGAVGPHHQFAVFSVMEVSLASPASVKNAVGSNTNRIAATHDNDLIFAILGAGLRTESPTIGELDRKSGDNSSESTSDPWTETDWLLSELTIAGI